MRSSRVIKNSTSVVENAMLLADLINDDDYWKAFSKDNQIPTYIQNLQKIAADFEEMGFSNDANIAERFIRACIEISGPELLKFEKRVQRGHQTIPGYKPLNINPNAISLYAAIQGFSKDDFKLCLALIKQRDSYLSCLALQRIYYSGDMMATMKKFNKEYAAFKKRIRWSEKPDLLVMMDFINASTPGKAMGEMRIGILTPYIYDYTKSALARSTSLFLNSCRDATSLAICLRQDSYGVVNYNKRGEFEIARIYELPDPCEKDINNLRILIMEKALDKHFFGKIFKEASDIIKFTSVLGADNTCYSIGAHERHGYYRNRLIIDMLERHLLSDRTLLTKITNSKEGTQLFKIMPKLKDACKKAAYSAAAKGLLFSKKYSDNAIRQLPKDIIKKISRETAELIEADFENNMQKRKW